MRPEHRRVDAAASPAALGDAAASPQGRLARLPTARPGQLGILINRFCRGLPPEGWPPVRSFCQIARDNPVYRAPAHPASLSWKFRFAFVRISLSGCGGAKSVRDRVISFPLASDGSQTPKPPTHDRHEVHPMSVTMIVRRKADHQDVRLVPLRREGIAFLKKVSGSGPTHCGAMRGCAGRGTWTCPICQ
jgi:hypothetical protein